MRPQSSESMRTRVLTSLAAVPSDVAIVIVYTLVAGSVLASVQATAVRLAVGLPLVFFVPGYAIVSLLFPRSGQSMTPSAAEGPVGKPGRISLTERFALSFGVSVGVLPPLGVGFSILGLPPVAETFEAALVTLTLLCIAAGAVRRRSLPEPDRFALPLGSWYDRFVSAVTADSRPVRAVNVALVFAVVIGLGALTLSLVAPMPGDSYSSLSLETTGTSGDPVTAGYPTNLTAAESASLTVSVANHEHERTDYTVVVQLQRLAEDNETVIETTTVDEFAVTLEDGERYRETREFTPSMTGENLRLTYLLYRGEPPSDPTTDNAYRTTYLWVDVADG